ncbi:hypothetical protein [Nitrosomonas mobilis]|uniref:Class I SAM-dependent methyltransferase n=1 Tax=Nitrosomonas mobilis TaxID=51642 RepID=A0A1G5SFD6_9PROT|nr:hypothetical protein [Nitrosomonas mobilis]SCZ85838.1 conserved membrane hypothetical protein [Nitrosomonas mobilis]
MTLNHSVIKAIAVQLASLTITALAVTLLPWSISWFQAAGLQGGIAAMISFCLPATPYWWRLIHLAFVPTLLVASLLQLPPYWYLIGFIILALIFGRIYRTQVPLFLSSQQTIRALAELLPQKQPFSMVDLGSGCGGVICKLAKVLPNGRYDGVETAILPCWIGKLRVRLFHQACRFRWKNIWQHNLSSYDVVYAYLSPVPMPDLWQKVTQEMRPGSLFISNTFSVPGVTPDYSIALNDFSGSALHVWKIK